MKRIPPYKRQVSTKGDFAAEIEQVLKTGHSSKGKLFRSDLGEITIDKGIPGNPQKDFKGGWGLDHIKDKQTAIDGIDGDAYVREILPEILSSGKLERLYGSPRRRLADVNTKHHQTTFRLDRDGKPEKWLLTGFKK